MPRVVHFEVVAHDPARVAQFYGDVFGWKIQRWDGPMEYYLVQTGEKEEAGIDGGIARTHDTSHPALTVNVVEVPSVDQYVEKATTAGGTVAVPRMPIPGVGWLAYCKDPEGVLFGLMETDPNAG
ncbi:MAG: VOC family protein [Armatimonadetes bacterium]|nr:VOC family protein [Armatimonadota bacterium]